MAWFFSFPLQRRPSLKTAFDRRFSCPSLRGRFSPMTAALSTLAETEAPVPTHWEHDELQLQMQINSKAISVTI